MRIKFLSVFIISMGLMFACSGNSTKQDDLGNHDAFEASDTATDTDSASDTVTVSDTDTASAPDTEDVQIETTDIIEVKMVKRRFSFKAIGGVSMGAESVVLAANHPGYFDFVGSMGGYVDLRYFSKVLTHQIFGGFCPMDQILENIDHINEKDNPNVFCGPVQPDDPYEWKWDFNHWHADNSGGHWGRNFYLDVIEGLMFAYGNLFSYNKDNPLMPPGVPLSWLNDQTDAAKCENPAVVGKPNNYNAEYNPEGKYNLITFCDGQPDCGNDNKAEWLDCAGNYDPDAPNTHPVYMLLAVDYNNNGRRDYGEPVVINSYERFDDVGTDGCADAYEDGNGGCLDKPTKKADSDPNNDNFDLINNPGGTENDYWWETGEPYRDYGLDGVADTGDYGEDNGKYDLNPNLVPLIENSARKFFATAPEEEINKTDFMFDGGIRDAIHALTCAMNMTIPLRLRNLDFHSYSGLAGTADSFWPTGNVKDFLTNMDKVDYSGMSKGKNLLIAYGNPNATAEEIFKGDGKHVGSVDQITDRLVIFMNMAVRRMPDPIIRTSKTIGKAYSSSYYSDVLKCRRNYALYLPPDYDTMTDEHYPVIAFITGHGMTADSIAQAGPLFGTFMAKAKLPLFMMAVPAGQCCYRHKDDLSKRECACWEDKSNWNCVDPDCKAEDQADCQMNTYPKNEMVQECNSGHFFVNFKSDRWGNTDMASKMKYEDSMFEFLDYMDKHYRTRKPAEYTVPVNW